MELRLAWRAAVLDVRTPCADRRKRRRAQPRPRRRIPAPVAAA
jgi:hypothetical protein